MWVSMDLVDAGGRVKERSKGRSDGERRREELEWGQRRVKGE